MAAQLFINVKQIAKNYVFNYNYLDFKDCRAVAVHQASKYGPVMDDRRGQLLDSSPAT